MRGLHREALHPRFAAASAVCAAVLLLAAAAPAHTHAADLIARQLSQRGKLAGETLLRQHLGRRHGRALAGVSCTGCAPGACLPASGCSACDDDAGYQPDGNGGCTQGTPADVSRVAASTKFALHPLLSSNGVIASGASGAVFGFGSPKASVTVTLRDARNKLIRSAKATVNSSGLWMAKLGSMKAGTGYTLRATSGKTTLKSSNIAVGQLWLAAGQSNAFVSLGDIATYAEPWRSLARKALSSASTNKSLRLLKVPNIQSSQQKTTINAKWATPSYNTVNTFSALGYLTGLQLQQATRVPIGIVQSSYGGTSIVQWIPPAVLKTLRVPTTSRTTASKNLFNTMIAPLTYADFTGVTWYQGESDGGLTLNSPIFAFYDRLLSALLSSWRSTLRNSRLRFEIVQLPNYASWYSASSRTRQNLGHWPFVREAQRQVAARDSYADLVATIDVGEPNQVHPPNKWDVAARLVRVIRRNRMRLKVTDSGPTFRSVAYATRQAKVNYDNASGGLIAGVKTNSIGRVSRQSKTTALACFELYYNRKWYPATAKLSSSTAVIVTATSKIGRPSGVRYAWADAPKCNLFSGVLLPAVPFTTDKNYAVAARSKYG